MSMTWSEVNYINTKLTPFYELSITQFYLIVAVFFGLNMDALFFPELDVKTVVFGE
jgi:hypothetical protein